MSSHLDNEYVPGDHWVECDVCGCEFRASQIKIRWDGAAVCEDDWEMRQPQDYVRAKKDKITPSGPIRDEPEDEFVTVTQITDNVTPGLTASVSDLITLGLGDGSNYGSVNSVITSGLSIPDIGSVYPTYTVPSGTFNPDTL